MPLQRALPVRHQPLVPPVVLVVHPVVLQQVVRPHLQLVVLLQVQVHRPVVLHLPVRVHQVQQHHEDFNIL